VRRADTFNKVAREADTTRQWRYVDSREIDKRQERQAEHGRHDTEISISLAIPDQRFKSNGIDVDGKIASQQMQQRIVVNEAKNALFGIPGVDSRRPENKIAVRKQRGVIKKNEKREEG